VERILSVLVLISLFSGHLLSAQAPGRLEGRVVLPTGEPAHRATVLIDGLGRVAETDEDGAYVFDNVPAGRYDVLAFLTPLDSESVPVQVGSGQTVPVDIELRLAPVRTEITVTATGREQTAFEAIPSITSLDAFELSDAMATSIGEVLQDELGVAKRGFGPGNARPVVRGFDGDRVLVMSDGMRTGSLASQSGDHGEPIDVSNLERIEILKGPATLLYGSNAIGGVVNAISSHQSFHQEPHEGLIGQVSTSVGSANSQLGGSYNVEYGAGPWQLWTGAGGQRTRDYDSPLGPVPNSKSRISNGSLGVGWFGSRGFASFGYNGNEGRYGIPFANDFESLDAIDLALREHNYRFTGGLRRLGPAIDQLEFSVKYSDYNHDEIEILDGEAEVGTTFENQEYLYRAVATQAPRGRLSGSVGFEGRHRDYSSFGEEALSPPVLQNGFSVFGLEELDMETLKLQFGARLERNSFDPESGSGLPSPAFTGVSAGIGARFDLWEGGAFVANYTDSYRSPAIEELYNNGPHVGNLVFEVGDPTLGRERSHGLDFSLRQESDRLRGEVDFFLYSISDFVFLAPTGNIEDGLNEAIYDQEDARFLGAESRLDIGLSDYLWLNLGFDTVDAQLRASSVSLPRVPPMRGRVGLDFRYDNLSIRPEIIVADRREDIFTTETPTAGYGVVNLEASYDLPGPHATHHFSVEVFNLGDKLYRNHLSFIKDLAPEIGRGVRFGYAVKLF
jgi:iron complex outermembrane recepter protein